MESSKVRSTAITEAEIDVTLLRAERLKKVLRRATSARYDRKARMSVVNFVNGAVFSFSASFGSRLLNLSHRTACEHQYPS